MQSVEMEHLANPVPGITAPAADMSLMQQKHIDDLQDKLVSPFIRLFIFLNGSVYVLILLAWIGDVVTKPANPIITESVIMTLIGASIVQSGAAILSITRFLFPTLKAPASRSS